MEVPIVLSGDIRAREGLGCRRGVSGLMTSETRSLMPQSTPTTPQSRPTRERQLVQRMTTPGIWTRSRHLGSMLFPAEVIGLVLQIIPRESRAARPDHRLL
jgi:hypothetical protein